MNISKILLAAALVAVSSTAFAEFYVGINTGASWGKYDYPDGGALKKTRVPVEGVIGYDNEFGPAVVGMDLEFGTTFAKLKKPEFPQISGQPKMSNLVIKTPWHAALMARLGYKFIDDLEIYATAGAKVLHHKFSYTVTPALQGAPTVQKAKATKVRLVAGCGIKYDIMQNLFLKAEYTHMIKGNVKNQAKYQDHAVKLGVGYKF